jgi:hypothetical protein
VAKIDVNTCSRADLIEQAGLRPEQAQEILELRARQGGIADLEELGNVRGIGPATLNQLRGLLKLGAQASGTGQAVANEGARVTSLAAYRRSRSVAPAASTPDEAGPSAAASEGAAAFAQRLVEAMKEQADDNLRTGLALTRAWHLGQVLALQSRWLRASLARVAALNAGYVELIHKAMARAVAEERGRLGRAA